MAVLKRIKFGNDSNNIAKTVVTAKSGGVMSVGAPSGVQNTVTEDADYQYELDVNVDGTTLVKSTTTGQDPVTQLAVGTVPAAQVSVAAGGHDSSAAEPDGKIFVGDDVEEVLTELNNKISQTGGAAKSYKIVEAASPASTSLKEYKVQVAVGDSAFADDSASATIVVPKDQHLKSVSLEDQDDQHTAGQFLKFTYVLNDGSESDVYVDVSAFLTQSEFGDGLEVSNAGVVSAKLGNGIEFGNEATGNKSLNVKIDSTSETDSQATPAAFLSVGANGVKISGIKDEIDRKIAALDYSSDAAVAGQYITYISETDGVVAVGGREDIADAPLNNYSKGSDDGAVASTDTINQAISKLENQIEAVADAADAAHSVVAKDTNAGHLTVTPTTDQSTGAVTYTIGESDIASDSDLDAEVTRAQAAEGEIAGLVGLGGTEGARTFTPTTNYGGNSASVAANMQALDTQVKANADAIATLSEISYSVSGTELTFYGIPQHSSQSPEPEPEP